MFEKYGMKIIAGVTSLGFCLVLWHEVQVCGNLLNAEADANLFNAPALVAPIYHGPHTSTNSIAGPGVFGM